MNYIDFSKKFVEALKNRGVDVELREINKVNEKLTGIYLRETTAKISAVPYMERLHDAYERGISMEQLLDDTIYTFHNVDLSYDEFEFINKENAKDCLFTQLINKEKNQELLATVPHVDIQDMALIARYRVNENANILVSNENCVLWQMTPDEVMQIARSNSEKEYSFENMEDVIRNSMLRMGVPLEEISDLLPENIDKAPMYVLSTPNGNFGASLCTSKEVMGSIYKKFDETNLYVLPSSTHEVIVVPDIGFISEEMMKDTIREANKSAVTEKDYLSDNLYYYNGKTHQLTLAEDKMKDLSDCLSKENSNHRGR